MNEVKEAGIFSNETSDVSRRDQVSIVLRYVDGNSGTAIGNGACQLYHC